MIQSPAESFKPIPVRVGEGRVDRLRHAARCLVDLQLDTICRFLARELPEVRGDVLDVGCGEMPFRGMLPAGVRYVGIDVPQATTFGMTRSDAIVAFDGSHIPFPDGSFDHILCTEVLEHAEHPQMLISEMRRVLRPGGSLIATVPFSARVHHAPHDHHRFTPFRLAAMTAAFASVRIAPRGDDLAVIANKLIVVAMRLARPSPKWLWRLPLMLAMAPIALVFLAVAHLSGRFGWGALDDPLGYGIVAVR